jgi:hypothetical protein
MQIILDPVVGTAEAWIYGFYSPDDHQIVSGLAVDHPQKGTVIGEIGTEEWDPTMDTTRLPSSWVDSDIAADAWGQHGVTAFLSSHPTAYAVGFVLLNSPSDGPAWASLLTDGTDSLACTLNAITTEIIECGLINAIADLSAPTDFNVGEIYPNPSTRGSSLSIEATGLKETKVTVTVYDLCGRLLGMAYDGTVIPGTTKIKIPSGIIMHSGIYLVKAQSREGIITRSFVVVY